MTADEERDLVAAAAASIDDELRAALAQIIRAIQDGTEPREAVAAAMDSFRGHMAETMAAALSSLMAAAIGSEAALVIEVGAVALSQRLYAEALAVGEAVQGIVQRHVRGFQDARALALEMFEGYEFRDPAAEVLKLAPGNPDLPKYLREALLADPAVANNLAKAFAKIQVDNLSTPALQAAYRELLEAIDKVESTAGQALLEKKLRVAFYERMRYFAQRIAQTELHRAYAEREAQLLLEDRAVEFVQLRRAPGRHQPCICALLVGRNLYGLGAGVYPKRQAPVPPFHPFCMCVQSPRLDLTGRTATARDEGGDRYFLNKVGESMAAQVMGSQAKRDRVLAGAAAEAVASETRLPMYRIKRAGEVT